MCVCVCISYFHIFISTYYWIYKFSFISHIYIYIYISSCRTASMDLLDPLSPPISIVHRSWDVFKAIFSIGTDMLYIGFSWLSCLCSSMWRVHWSISLMSSSLLLEQCHACLVRLTWIEFVLGVRWPYSCCFCRLLPPGLVQYCSQHSCIITVKLFLHTLS